MLCRLFSSCSAWASHCGGFSLWGLLLWSTKSSVAAAPGFQGTGSGVVAHGLSCSPACRIFLGQRSNLCLLHWQADSLSLSHQGSPLRILINHLEFSSANCLFTFSQYLYIYFFHSIFGLPRWC